jgi:hypothetical protein
MTRAVCWRARAVSSGSGDAGCKEGVERVPRTADGRVSEAGSSPIWPDTNVYGGICVSGVLSMHGGGWSRRKKGVDGKSQEGSEVEERKEQSTYADSLRIWTYIRRSPVAQALNVKCLSCSHFSPHLSRALLGAFTCFPNPRQAVHPNAHPTNAHTSPRGR